MTAAADRHLLFGLLALQNGLIDQSALVAAFQAWTRDKREAEWLPEKSVRISAFRSQRCTAGYPRRVGEPFQPG
jgi:hypothetical protein